MRPRRRPRSARPGAGGEGVRAVGRSIGGVGLRRRPGAGADGQRAGGGCDFLSANTDFWSVFHTDQSVPADDTVNLWGCCASAGSGKVPAASRCGWSSPPTSPSGANPPITQVEVETAADRAFTGSLDLRDVPEGYYRAELVEDGEVVASQPSKSGASSNRLIGRGRDGSSRVHRRRSDQGHRHASFYEGTPVPGVPLRVGEFLDLSPTTDATGTPSHEARPCREDDSEREGPRFQSVFVSPARAEEGADRRASREFLVFPSMWTVAAESEIRGGRVEDLGHGQRRRSRSARGRDRRWHSRSGTSIRAARRSGTGPSDLLHRAHPPPNADRHDVRLHREAGRPRLPVRHRGTVRGTLRVAHRQPWPVLRIRPRIHTDHDYTIKVSLTDPDGHVALTSSYAYQGSPVADLQAESYVSLTDLREDSDGSGFGSVSRSTSRCAGLGRRPLSTKTATSSTSPSRACANSLCSRRRVRDEFPDWGRRTSTSAPFALRALATSSAIPTSPASAHRTVRSPSICRPTRPATPPATRSPSAS